MGFKHSFLRNFHSSDIQQGRDDCVGVYKLFTPLIVSSPFRVHEEFMAQLETPTTRRIVTFTLYPVKHDFRGFGAPFHSQNTTKAPSDNGSNRVRLTAFIGPSYKRPCRPDNSADEVFTQVDSALARNSLLRKYPVRPGPAKEIPELHRPRQRLRQHPRSTDKRETRIVAHQFREYDRDSDCGRYGYVIGGPPHRRVRQRALPRMGHRREDRRT